MSQPPTILAAALKSKKLAIAIFCGELLIYYRSSGLASKQKCPEKIAAENIENLIHIYKPNYLAIEELVYKQQQIPAMTDLRQKVIKISRKRGLTIKSYAPDEVRNLLCCNLRATNIELANVLVSHYPELKKFWRGLCERQLSYQQILFKSIAIGLCCERDVRQAPEY